MFTNFNRISNVSSILYSVITSYSRKISICLGRDTKSWKRFETTERGFRAFRGSNVQCCRTISNYNLGYDLATQGQVVNVVAIQAGS